MLVTDEIIEEAVLSHAQRLNKGNSMRRNSNRLVHAKDRAKNSMASSHRLTHRSKRAARHIVRKLVAGKLGAKYHELSPEQKSHVDKHVENKKVLINNLAKRLFPHVREAEIQRYKQMRAEQQQ